jgi:SAM-dependent methyltransferase
VLNHVYAPIYVDAIRAVMLGRAPNHAFRILEYGCGGGMNLLKAIELIAAQGATLEHAYGADFSPPMIEAAKREASDNLPTSLHSRISYVVAANQSLASDLARNAGLGVESLDLVIGVNTFRYAHRAKSSDECARDIHALLRPNGYSIMIDMNRGFPLFRSKVRARLAGKEEDFLPSLGEYRDPFVRAGFDIVDARNFCWIPHSASPLLLAACRAATPVLDACFAPFAMRSLVVARKGAR